MRTTYTMLINDEHLNIFTDGSSLGNPGPGGYGAVIAFPKLDEVIELGGAKPETTNNEMELAAIVAALSYSVHNTAPVTVFTDSKYVVNGITSWIKNWEQNGWKTQAKADVTHKQLWQDLLKLVRERESSGPVSWQALPGHAGINGNERADEIATSFASGKPTELFRGRLSDYDIDVRDVSVDEKALAKKKAKSKSNSGPAYSYLSYLNGKLMRHETWKDTESRVKGTPAKFKKALSADHEKEIVSDWGLDPRSLNDL